MLVGLLAVLAACGPSPGPDLAPAPADSVRGSGTLQLVVGSDGCHEIWTCDAFRPFYRPGDLPAGPVFWLISLSGWACVVDAHFFHGRAGVLRGKQHRCAWRAPQ